MRWRRRIRESFKDALPAAVYTTAMRAWYGPLRRRQCRANAAVRRAHGLPTHRIAFAPSMPTNLHVITAMCTALGVTMTRRTGRADVVIAWKDATRWEPPARVMATRPVNSRCTDISKTRVNEAFEEVFGYPLGIDPTSHRGVAVEKADANATHDGAIVTCPRERRPGRTYQRLVDNLVDGGSWALDLRIPIVGRSVPLVYERRRTPERRFLSGNSSCKVVDAGDHLDDTELARVLDFAKAMGLDLGEVDALRDAADGRLYIVDVNNTPHGPPSGITLEEGVRATQILAAAFEEQLLTEDPP